MSDIETKPNIKPVDAGHLRLVDASVAINEALATGHTIEHIAHTHTIARRETRELAGGGQERWGPTDTHTQQRHDALASERYESRGW